MNSYTNIFGGQNINPADLSYKAYSLTTEDIHLEWPFEALDGSRVVADKIDIGTTDINRAIWMPDASKVSVGEDVLWNNVGATLVTVRDFDGNTILTISPGQQWYLYLIDNGTPAGVWRTTQLGAGTSAANAVALAGFGLRANVTKLDQNLLTNGVVGDILLTASARAQVFRNTGGVAIHTFSAAAALGPTPANSNGWFVIEINAGSGNVVLTPQVGELIDGAASKTLAPGESCVVYCYGTGFATMGYGRAFSTTVAAAIIDISGPPPANPVVLTAPQVGAQVQNFNGALTANRIVEYGPIVGYWFVWNDTNGAFTTTFRTNSVDPGVVVLQHNFSILRSDGATMSIAFTATSGTITKIETVPGETTGGPPPTGITSTGTIGLADTAVTPGAYGDAANVPVITFDQKGRATLASEVPIAISASQVTDFVAQLQVLIPTGICVPFAALPGLNPDPGTWQPCNGQLLNKLTFSRLYTAIGDQYGVGDADNFRVPDLDGRTIAGLDNGRNRLTTPTINTPNTPGGVGGLEKVSLGTADIPALSVSGITGTFTGTGTTLSLPTNSISGSASAGGGSGAGSTFFTGTLSFTASGGYTPAGTWAQSGTGTTTATTTPLPDVPVVQPTMVMRYFIKT